MSTLGIAPLVLVAGGAAGSSALFWAGESLQSSYDEGRINSLLQWMGLKNTPAIPKSPSPAMQAPPAPQTAAKLTTWTPDDLWESTVQRAQQYSKDMEFMKSVSRPTGLIRPIESDANGDETRFWLLIGAGTLAAVILLRR